MRTERRTVKRGKRRKKSTVRLPTASGLPSWTTKWGGAGGCAGESGDVGLGISRNLSHPFCT